MSNWIKEQLASFFLSDFLGGKVRHSLSGLGGLIAGIGAWPTDKTAQEICDTVCKDGVSQSRSLAPKSASSAFANTLFTKDITQ